MKSMVDAVERFADGVAGAVDALTDTLFNPPIFTRPERPRRPAPKPRRPRVPPCKNCKWFRQRTPVICTKDELGVVFDVATAETLARESGREPVEFAPRRLRHYVTRADINPHHLAHVDRRLPGVMGTIRRKGRLRLVLIEGHHRAYNALRARLPYPLYLLTEEETARCLK
jgi:hypothetical protein